jgi:hypothetical protein
MSYLTPKASKKMTRASMFRETLGFIVGDNNVLRILRLKIHPNGYVSTLDKKNREYYFLPRPSLNLPMSNPSAEGLDDDAQIIKEEQTAYEDNLALTQLEKEVLNVITLEGCKIPCIFGYAGVAVGTNPGTILGLQFDDQTVQTKLVNVVSKSKNKKGKIKETVKTVTARLLLPVNPKVIKKYFPRLIDQASVDAFGDERYKEGFTDGKSTKNEKMFLYMMLILGALIIGGAIVLSILK